MRRTANAVTPAAPASSVQSTSLVSPLGRVPFLAITLTVVMTFVLAASVGATVIVVDQSGGGDYLTVQEGVDAAASRDTVRVMGGWYQERVVVDGKCLTIEGSGPSVTAVFWDGAGATLEFVNTPTPYWSHVRNINFAHSFDAARGGDRQVHTVEWTGSTVTFDGAVINGGAIGIADVANHLVYTGVSSYGSTFDWLIVAGYRDFTIDETIVFEGARFSGWYEDPVTMGSCFVTSMNSSYGWLELPMLCYLSSYWDSIGRLEIEGTFETSCTAQFLDADIGEASLQNENDVAFYDCVVDQMSRHGPSYPGFRLTLEGCLVEYFSLIAEEGDLRFIHNTFPGWFYCQPNDPGPSSAIRSNIFVSYTTIHAESGGSPVLPVTHNLFMDEDTYVTALPDSLLANIWFEDARFCPGEYTVEDCSICIGHAHDGGIIGAFGVGCDCTLVNAVEERSWGAIKALYR